MDDGFRITPRALPSGLLDSLRERFSPTGASGLGGLRNALDVDEVLEAAQAMRPLAAQLHGASAGSMTCVRGIVFDKTPAANWKVAWHQDRSIAVERRHEVPSFGPWSIKGGVQHVQPAVGVLERMLTLRLHLDPCGEGNGPLRVIPASHCLGILNDSQIREVRAQHPEIVLTCDAGDVIAMRPLLLHASSEAVTPGRRRVVHLEFSTDELPSPLTWRWAI
jgi:ectoine hydroxylase-related dioxygenase (phytanoyl-CoA dioxygenase family)